MNEPTSSSQEPVPPLVAESAAASTSSSAPMGAERAQAPGSTPGWERDVLEKLAFASLKEQRSARRWGIFFKLVTLLYVGIVIAAVASFGGGRTHEPLADHTAMVAVDGVIDAGGENSAERINSALKDAFEEPRVKGVILRINSPGGSPVQAGMIADEMTRLRALHPDKPLYAVVEDTCASGGYYIAAAAANIYVDKASLVGSIGVIMDSFGVVDLMNKVGVERRAITAGENKALLDPFQPLNDNHKRHLQAMLDEIHEQFITVVRTGRGQRLKESPEIFSGLVWNGAKAVELGLADGLGTVDTVARDVIQAPDVVDYTIQESAIERLSRRIATQAGTTLSQTLARSLSMAAGPSLR